MRQTILIRKDICKVVKSFSEESRLKAYDSLMTFAITGKYIESRNPAVDRLFAFYAPTMRYDSIRRAISVANGKKGGRPPKVPTDEIMKMKAEGMTHRQIAEKIGVTVGNIDRRVSKYRKHQAEEDAKLVNVQGISDDDYSCDSPLVFKSKMANDPIIFRKDVYEKVNRLQNNLRLEAYDGLIEHQLSDTIPQSDNPEVSAIFTFAIPATRTAAERRAILIANGKKGGRPPKVPTTEIVEMRESGMTIKQIAEKLDVTEQNIRYRLRCYRKRQAEEAANPTDITVSTYNNVVLDTIEETNNIAHVQEQFISGDGFPGKRVQDMTREEAEEIKHKLNYNIPYIDIERQYGMRRGTISPNFAKVWDSYQTSESSVVLM